MRKWHYRLALFIETYDIKLDGKEEREEFSFIRSKCLWKASSTSFLKVRDNVMGSVFAFRNISGRKYDAYILHRGYELIQRTHLHMEVK